MPIRGFRNKSFDDYKRILRFRNKSFDDYEEDVRNKSNERFILLFNFNFR